MKSSQNQQSLLPDREIHRRKINDTGDYPLLIEFTCQKYTYSVVFDTDGKTLAQGNPTYYFWKNS